MGYVAYSFPKSVYLIKKCILIGSQKNDIIADFFAGSGTTAQAVIELNRDENTKRKYIISDIDATSIEVIKERIMKNVFSTKWISGLPKNNDGISHILKYCDIEQYEDTLNNIEFKNDDGVIQKSLDRFPDYFLSYILKFETRESSTNLNLDKFKKPFDYRIKTLSSGGEKEGPVDLVETFNLLIGLHIEKYLVKKSNDRIYFTTVGECEQEQIAVIWRDTEDLDLEDDKRFIEDVVLAGLVPDTIYINGDSYLKNAKPIEFEFRRRMSASTN
jgi:adenine-specific DNA-methyltransferase